MQALTTWSLWGDFRGEYVFLHFNKTSHQFHQMQRLNTKLQNTKASQNDQCIHMVLAILLNLVGQWKREKVNEFPVECQGQGTRSQQFCTTWTPREWNPFIGFILRAVAEGFPELSYSISPRIFQTDLQRAYRKSSVELHLSQTSYFLYLSAPFFPFPTVDVRTAVVPREAKKHSLWRCYGSKSSYNLCIFPL